MQRYPPKQCTSVSFYYSSYHTHYCFHIRSQDQFYMSRTEHFGHAPYVSPWPCFRAPGRGGWKNRINLAGKVAKNTVSVLPNILYPYCQTYCIRTAKHSPLKCDLIFHAECLFWWAWIRSVNFLWATATAPIFLHSLSPRPVNIFCHAPMARWHEKRRVCPSLQMCKLHVQYCW